MRALGLGLLVALVAAAPAAAAQPRASIVNGGHAGERVKTTFFFSGSWRDGNAQFYERRPASNDCLYTVFPVDSRHLGWSESEGNRLFALEAMEASGVNVVTASHWGPPGTDNWAFWAPMQTSPASEDELFDAAVATDTLVTPAIESSAATQGQQQTGCRGELGPTGTSPAYSFANDFPGTPGNPAPGLVARVKDLLRRFVLEPRNRAWPSRWTRMRDRDGRARYVVHIIQATSNQLCPQRLTCSALDDEHFAAGFGWAAAKILADTGLRVGFLIDVMPPQARLLFRYVPEAAKAGPLLERQPALLGMQSFIPEAFFGPCRDHNGCDSPLGSPELSVLGTMKRDFVRSWIASGVPVIVDVGSGYDGHKVFTEGPRYGNNAQWRAEQEPMLGYGGAGLAFNSWNGYTEAMVAVPGCRGLPIVDGPPGLPQCPDSTGADAAYRWWSGLEP